MNGHDHIHADASQDRDGEYAAFWAPYSTALAQASKIWSRPPTGHGPPAQRHGPQPLP
ncbi:hypothetical protein AHiyo8_pI68320 (plasmid) [Arthrobacter sp. Hiyo8]|nr:hypothetical protein AHiyo8_pI68320 [Arthrobacter sp. Hiyo8]GAP60738.1 hypothetical protein AHiyo1_43220 [Arthrobacter sp. Hiyo1]